MARGWGSTGPEKLRLLFILQQAGVSGVLSSLLPIVDTMKSSMCDVTPL